MRIDLIALDLDGTLLGPDEDVSVRNRDAVRRALESGVRVVLVTGRGVNLPMRIARELNLNLPVICCHGALTKDFGANRTLVHIPIDIVRRANRSACRMVSVVSNAVIMTASMSGCTNRSRSNTSMPDMPAMRMSRMATSTGFFRASSIAVGPSSAISKSY